MHAPGFLTRPPAPKGTESADTLMALLPRPSGLAVALSLSLWLSACGGGSGDSPAPPPPPAPPPTALPDLDIVLPAQADLGAAVAISTSAAPASALKVQWDFGDGTTATEAAPQHQFARAGELTVKLTLTNEAGAQKTFSKSISLTNKALVKGNFCSGDNDQGWCWMPPQQTGGNAVKSIFFANPNTGWRVGDLGEIFKTTDAGKTWSRQASGTTASLDRIIVRSSNEAMAVGIESKTLLITADGGQTWKKQSLPGNGALNLLGNSQVLVVPPTSASMAYYLDDVAGTWKTLDLGIYEQISVGVDGSVVTYTAGKFMRRATPTAAPQTVFTLPPLDVTSTLDRVAMNRTSDRVLFVTRTYIPPTIGTPDKPPILIYRSTDGGQQWQTIRPTFVDGLNDLWRIGGGQGDPRPFYSDETGLNVAMMSWGYSDVGTRREETLLTSNDGGATWRTRLSGNVYNPYNCAAWGLRITCDGKNEGFTSADFGVTFTPTHKALNYWGYITRLWPMGGALGLSFYGYLYAVSYDTQVWHPIAGSLPASVPSFGTRKIGRRVLNGSLYATEDGGKSWTELGRLEGNSLTLPDSTGYAWWTAEFLVSATMLDERTTIIFGERGSMAVSRDGGATWTRSKEPNSIRQLGFQDGSLGWAMGSASLFTTRDGGKSWKTVESLPTTTVISVRLGTDQQLTVISRDGSVYRSNDGGITWSTPRNIASAITSFFSSQDGSTFWATGAAGSVFRSADQGASWQRTQLPTTTDLLAVCFADAGNGWVSGKAGEMWATRDGGATWRKQLVPANQDLTQLTCQDSRTVWVAGQSGLLATGTGGD